MFRVALYQPEIAPNTGNIIRLAANCGVELHLIKPLGFELDDTRLRRAGLDYAEWQNIQVHECYQQFVEQLAGERLIAFSTRSDNRYTDIEYTTTDWLLFGPETRGLPGEVLKAASCNARLPMRPGSRSLNLSNAVAAACYEAWRQLGFEGATADNMPRDDGNTSAVDP